jgi:plasmid replication initiation protein
MDMGKYVQVKLRKKMKKMIRSFFIKLLKINKDDVSESLPDKLLEPVENAVDPVEIHDIPSEVKDVSILLIPEILNENKAELKSKKPAIKKQKIAKIIELSSQERAARDIAEMMEVPFLALSKNRKKPIVYEKTNGENTIKVRVSRHTDHFLASIYDWDIVLYVAGKIQKVLNDGSDIPPRTIIAPRHEILKSLRKHDGKKQELDLNASLYRLQTTTVETTIGNKEYKKGKVFSFIDSWGYTERKDIKEIEITISDWLYKIVCAKGALLMVDPDYFSLTSGLKKFLYRTARKHVGIQGNSWEFLIETLYEKSGSERDFRKFKSDLKSTVLENDIPGYSISWVEKNKNTYVNFNSIKKQNNKIITKNI